MELLVVRGGDTEGLLQESISSVDVLAASGGRSVLELAVCEETAGDAAWAPALTVSPASHAGFPLVKAVDGARADRLALDVRKSTVHTGYDSDVAGCVEDKRKSTARYGQKSDNKQVRQTTF